MKEKYKTRIPQYTKTYRDKKRLSGLCYEGGCNETASAFGQQCEFHKRKATRAARDRVMGENASTHRDHLIREQDGRCAICQETMTRPNQDHDHKTGKLRGVLCGLCNVALERMERDGWGVAAFAYLQKWA